MNNKTIIYTLMLVLLVMNVSAKELVFPQDEGDIRISINLINSSGLWNESGSDILPHDATLNLKIPSLVSCDTIDTDANGVMSCGTDGTGAAADPTKWKLVNFTGAYEAELPTCAAGEYTTSDGSDLTCSTPAGSSIDTTALDIVNVSMWMNNSIIYSWNTTWRDEGAAGATVDDEDVNLSMLDNGSIIRNQSVVNFSEGYIRTYEIATLHDLTGGNLTITTIIEVRNDEPTTLSAGNPVHFTGYVSGVNRLSVEFANNSNTMTHADCVIAETIATNGLGQCVVAGDVVNTDTSGFAFGDDLYLSYGGNLTNIRPNNAVCVQKVGMVLRSHASNGVIWVLGAGRCNDVPNRFSVLGDINASVFYQSGNKVNDSIDLGDYISDVSAYQKIDDIWKISNDTSNYLAQLALNISGGHLLTPTNTTWAIKTVNDSIKDYYNHSIDLGDYIDTDTIFDSSTMDIVNTSMLDNSTINRSIKHITIGESQIIDLAHITLDEVGDEANSSLKGYIDTFDPSATDDLDFTNFTDADNISVEMVGGNIFIWFNMTCEQFTGGAGLCDGTDATSSLDTDTLYLVNTSMLDNNTIIRTHNSTWAIETVNDSISSYYNHSIDLSNYNFSLDLSNYYTQAEADTADADTTYSALSEFSNDLKFVSNSTDVDFDNVTVRGNMSIGGHGVKVIGDCINWTIGTTYWAVGSGC